MRTYTHHIREVIKDSISVSLTLLKILIPAILIVRLLDLMGVADRLADLLGTPLALLGLPAIAGFIWATTILTNIYGGMIVLFTFQQSWTLEQITVLSILMLGAHNMLVELAVAYKAKCRLLPMIMVRVLGSLGLAAIMHSVYQHLPEMQEKVVWSWLPETVDTSWSGWAKAQLEMLFWTQVIIFGLVAFIKICKLTGIERMIERLLQPLLTLIGIRKNALSMNLIGMTLGLAYGGGLLIREAEKGTLAARDIFASFCLLGLCHSLIEDTLLILLTGAQLHGILWARLAFALIVIAIITRILPRVSDRFMYKYLVRP